MVAFSHDSIYTYFGLGQFVPLGRQEVAYAVGGTGQRDAAEQQDHEHNVRRHGRNPHGLRQQDEHPKTRLKELRAIEI